MKHSVFIKGMVCDRCITAVSEVMKSFALQPTAIKLGEISFSTASDIPDHQTINEQLRPLGFSLLEDKRTALVREVKKLVEVVYNGEFDFPNGFRFSLFVSNLLNKDYDSISSVFSSMEQITMEQYIISYRIEKVKELLVYTNHTLADISFRLGFSSVAHLSRQFKSVTGINPSHFKTVRVNKEQIITEAKEVQC